MSHIHIWSIFSSLLHVGLPSLSSCMAKGFLQYDLTQISNEAVLKPDIPKNAGVETKLNAKSSKQNKTA